MDSQQRIEAAIATQPTIRAMARQSQFSNQVICRTLRKRGKLHTGKRQVRLVA